MNNIEARIQVLTELTNRMQLAGLMGQQYGGSRDLFDTLGYKKDLSYEDYLTQYIRQDIANAIIEKPIGKTWKGQIQVVDSDMNEKFRKAFNQFQEKFRLKNKLIQLDRQASLGQYAVLYLGLSDVKTPAQAKGEIAGSPKIVYLSVYGENQITIQEWENDTKSERYGLPKIYLLSTTTAAGNMSSIEAHWSRVLHVAYDCLEGNVIGEPALKKVFNRLQDIEKLSGGSAEMFWRGARPGYQGVMDKDYQLDNDADADLVEKINEYEHNLRRIIMMEGAKLEPLATQVSDPSPHLDLQLQLISSATQIPKRILVGSERGELASVQDNDDWLSYVQERREEVAEMEILKPLIKKLIELKELPQYVGDYHIEWTDLFSVSDKDKAEVGRIRATALKEYLASPMAESIVTPEAFLLYFLGLSQQEADDIKLMMENELEKEIPIEEQPIEQIEE